MSRGPSAHGSARDDTAGQERRRGSGMALGPNRAAHACAACLGGCAALAVAVRPCIPIRCEANLLRAESHGESLTGSRGQAPDLHSRCRRSECEGRRATHRAADRAFRASPGRRAHKFADKGRAVSCIQDCAQPVLSALVRRASRRLPAWLCRAWRPARTASTQNFFRNVEAG